MKPTSREEFKDYCLRQLGYPVLNIELDDDQMDDRIDQGLAFYADYHFDGSEKIYYKHLITDEDKANKYITLPENILGAVKLFRIGSSISQSDGLFNIQYQIALNDLYTLTSISLVPYYMAMQHLALIEELLVGDKPIRYNRHRNRLHIDMDWNKVNTGQYLLVEAYDVVDPDEFTDVWNDRWLLQYVTQLFKKQWGVNRMKYEGVQLPGGVTTTGYRDYIDADQKISEMEADVINSYSLPVSDMYG